MRGFYRLFLVIGLLVVLAVPTGPARAAYIVHDPTSLAQMVIQFAKQMLGINTALGVGTVGTAVDLGTVDGQKIQDPCANKVFKSVIEQAECNRKFNAILAARMQMSSQQFQAQLAALAQKTAEGQGIQNYTQTVKDRTVSHAANQLGRERGACEELSVIRSRSVMAAIADKQTEASMAAIAEQNSGSSDMPAFARGPGEYWSAALNLKIQEGAVFCKGQDGNSIKLCGGEAGAAGVADGDERADTLLNTPTLNDQPKTPKSVKLAEMWKNNIFDRRSVSAVRSDKLEQRDNAAVEAFMKRVGYNSRTSLFMYPFAQEISNRSPIEGMDAAKALEGVLDQLAFPTDLKEKYVKQKKISREAADMVRYVEWMNDPKLRGQLNQDSALNMGNTMMTILHRSMDTVTLLFEIRQTLKVTNLLLGNIGSVLLRDQQEEIEGQVQSISAGN